jgi:hypothetical protein
MSLGSHPIDVPAKQQPPAVLPPASLTCTLLGLYLKPTACIQRQCCRIVLNNMHVQLLHASLSCSVCCLLDEALCNSLHHVGHRSALNSDGGLAWLGVQSMSYTLHDPRCPMTLRLFRVVASAHACKAVWTLWSAPLDQHP